MWPVPVDWKALRFGVEVEFVGDEARRVALLPGWRLFPDEFQVGADGAESGGEVVSPPLPWSRRAEIREVLARLRGAGVRANWSCGLHVHVDLGPWGEDAVLPLLEAALACQDALRVLLGTPEHRMLFCPAVTAGMRRAYALRPGRDALERPGRPQAHRCGVNARSWYDHGTVEIRYANGSLRYGQVLRTAELCLRFVAAVGADTGLASTPTAHLLRLVQGRGGWPPWPTSCAARWRGWLRDWPCSGSGEGMPARSPARWRCWSASSPTSGA